MRTGARTPTASAITPRIGPPIGAVPTRSTVCIAIEHLPETGPTGAAPRDGRSGTGDWALAGVEVNADTPEIGAGSSGGFEWEKLHDRLGALVDSLEDVNRSLDRLERRTREHPVVDGWDLEYSNDRDLERDDGFGLCHTPSFSRVTTRCRWHWPTTAHPTEATGVAMVLSSPQRDAPHQPITSPSRHIGPDDRRIAVDDTKVTWRVTPVRTMSEGHEPRSFSPEPRRLYVCTAKEHRPEATAQCRGDRDPSG
jgi:hypothetical protein